MLIKSHLADSSHLIVSKRWINCLKLIYLKVKFPDQLKLFYLFLQVKVEIRLKFKRNTSPGLLRRVIARAHLHTLLVLSRCAINTRLAKFYLIMRT